MINEKLEARNIELVLERDRLKEEVNKLTAESTEWESRCYKYQDIIDTLRKDILNYLEEWKNVDDEYIKGKCIMARDVLYDIDILQGDDKSE